MELRWANITLKVLGFLGTKKKKKKPFEGMG